jgi:hypothetical protein
MFAGWSTTLFFALLSSGHLDEESPPGPGARGPLPDRTGLIDMCAQAEVPGARLSDTPKAIWPLALCAPV